MINFIVVRLLFVWLLYFGKLFCTTAYCCYGEYKVHGININRYWFKANVNFGGTLINKSAPTTGKKTQAIINKLDFCTLLI